MKNLLKNPKFWLVLILLIGAALRFYNLSGYLQFLGDQGRDVLVVKRMIVDGKWTLLGPSASVGGFFTGPIYYYFMLPFLWAFRLDPVGPAYLAAILGVATIGVIYWFCAELFSKRAGLIAAFLVTISVKMIDISRFSWNPNPVPLFALLTMLCLYYGAKKERLLGTFLAGISLGIMVQLHYMDLVFIPIVAVAMFFIFPLNKLFFHALAMLTGFLLGDSLFLIFELRHDFPNIRSVWDFVSRRGEGETIGPKSTNILWLMIEVLRRLYGMTLGIRDSIWEYVFLTFSAVGSAVWLVKNWAGEKARLPIILLLVWLAIGTLGMGSYRGQWHDHYFGYLYPLPFVLLGIAIDWLFSKRLTIILGILALSFLGYFSLRHAYFLSPAHNMVDQVREIDRIVLDFAGNRPYNLALLSDYNSEFAYIYFLEIWERQPVIIENTGHGADLTTVAAQLIVICEKKVCDPETTNHWEVVGFGKAEIAAQKAGPAGIKIFKLVHYDES